MSNKQRKFVSPARALGFTRKQGGWTMIEILVSIAVVSLFIYWVASRGNLLGKSADGTTEAGNINLLHTQIRAAKTAAGYGPANSDLAAALISAQKVPSNMPTSGTTILNPWNVAYTITSSGYGFSMTDTVPAEACAGVVQNASQTGDWDTISVNGSAATAGPINLSVAGGFCSSTTTNTITFKSST